MASKSLPASSKLDRFPAIQELNSPARTMVRVSCGALQLRVATKITPIGLLAIGGMVASILVAVTPIVTAAGRAKTRR